MDLSYLKASKILDELFGELDDPLYHGYIVQDDLEIILYDNAKIELLDHKIANLDDFSTWKGISFEEFFDKLNEDNKKKVIYHLDFFKNNIYEY